MELIQLALFKRNNTSMLGSDIVIDVDNIISPIREKAEPLAPSYEAVSYFTVRTKLPTGLPGDLVYYEIDDILDQISIKSNNFVLLTVTSRNGRPLVVDGVTLASETMIFNVNKVAETFKANGGSVEFLYCEDGEPTPVSYIVSESLSDIMLQVSSGTGSGTVTSFSAGDLNPLFTTSEATPTTTPALSFAQVTQSANLIFSGPASGAAANPTFRSLVGDDLPIERITDPGNFTLLDQNQALKITILGTDYYIALHDYTP